MTPFTSGERAVVLRLNPQATHADIDQLEALHAERIAVAARAELSEIDRARREGLGAVGPGPAAEAAHIDERIAALESQKFPRLGEALAAAHEEETS